jgi:NAD(P)-dependent dehydrogenase (short-subunit alcohol dehydrogenase family)
MLKSGGGAIVNTASSAGLAAWPHNSVYGATKAGVVQLTKCAALDYAKQNIRVNAVCPGITWTGMVPGSSESPTPPADAPVPPGTPMERWGLPGEIAAAALFLASDEASFVTGTAVPVDGGYVAG